MPARGSVVVYMQGITMSILMSTLAVIATYSQLHKTCLIYRSLPLQLPLPLPLPLPLTPSARAFRLASSSTCTRRVGGRGTPALITAQQQWRMASRAVHQHTYSASWHAQLRQRHAKAVPVQAPLCLTPHTHSPPAPPSAAWCAGRTCRAASQSSAPCTAPAPAHMGVEGLTV